MLLSLWLRHAVPNKSKSVICECVALRGRRNNRQPSAHEWAREPWTHTRAPWARVLAGGHGAMEVRCGTIVLGHH